MPEEVRAEVAPWFIEKQAIKEDAQEKIVKLDKEAKYMNSDLKVYIYIYMHMAFEFSTYCQFIYVNQSEIIK